MRNLTNKLAATRNQLVGTTAIIPMIFAGALFPAFTQGQAAPFITWFRAQMLESGWIAAFAMMCLLGGVIGMFVGEQRAMKVFAVIISCIAVAFLGAGQILNMITAVL